MTRLLKTKKIIFLNKGFSLIEFIIVSAIIIIFSSIVFPNWNSIKQDVLLQREAYKVAQDIRRTLEMSLSTQEATCSGGVNGYLISFAKDQSSYSLYVDGGAKGLDGSECSIGQVDLDENVTIENISTGNDKVEILFIPPNPEVKFFSGGSELETVETVTITLSIKVDNNKKRNIVVNKAGLVYVE
jgi:prepilin-type N-terminal cleavage/methylation domain-containing protein